MERTLFPFSASYKGFEPLGATRRATLAAWGLKKNLSRYERVSMRICAMVVIALFRVPKNFKSLRVFAAKYAFKM